ncbi:succinate--CoA ligase subunit beta [Calderihabitans maritimus]|uniref:Succinate--CoA ligase n=1 Tax=Calderihabitans maritimus TaxID=1246530 RepID=A0A1Z5HU07_9FIRM|nr:succinate--CoA ligase subunit beta [Calderihabitans maritimus]GAW92805.1 Succinate--CoA ligase [Calderihabitans maritimus]
MARLLENQSKDILRQAGIPVPEYYVAGSPEQAAEIVEKLGKPVVLKALVPIGKRGKAGAIKFADNAEQARVLTGELLQMTVSKYPVQQVLVEEKLEIKEELYVSITIDRVKQLPVIIASLSGGIDVEELTKKHPEKVCTYYVHPWKGLFDYQSREIWAGLGVSGKRLVKLGGLLKKLYKVFEDYEAYILEINPLVVTTDDEIVAAASVMAIDDSAMFRHPELAGKVQMGTERAWRPLTDLEKKAVEVNEADPYRGTARYTEMEDGDIGFMCGGGGGSLLLFDALVEFGGRPANYSEFGGNPSDEKVYGLTKVILSKPGVKGLFVAQNITNNTQVDLVAKGVIRAIRELNIDPKDFPIVVREAGVNEETARRLFAEAGIEYYGDEITMTGAARRMVEKMKERYPGYGE